jgi:hypothetical protein
MDDIGALYGVPDLFRSWPSFACLHLGQSVGVQGGSEQQYA